MDTYSDLPLPSSILPRRSFRPAGKVLSAEYLPCAPKFPKAGTTSRAQRLGKRYEAKIYRELKKLNLDKLLIAPWITYVNSDGYVRSCQPDAVLFNSEKLFGVIFEIKYTHTIDAYFQLRQLYLPVMQKLHPTYRFYLTEITRSYDGAVQFPEPINGLYFDIQTYLKNLPITSSDISVLQWRL